MIAGLAALAIASTASAQTNIIRITGAQANRDMLFAAIGHILSPGYLYGYSGSAQSSASQAEYRGTTAVGGFPVDIRINLIGSQGGIQAVAKNISLNWTNATTLSASGQPNFGGATESAVADISLSDSFQSSSLYPTPVLNDQVVGATSYVAAKNNGATASISNLTAQVAQALLGIGQIPLSQITGNPPDSNVIVTVTGRDESAGQRVVPYAETGFGIFSAPFQYQPLISGTPGPSGLVTNLVPWPANNVLGITYSVGHSGYSTGSGLAAALNTPVSATLTNQGLGTLITFFSINDSLSVTNNGAGTLSYNGVYYSPQNVKLGKYSLWAYSHVFYRTSYSGTPKTIADQLANQIKTTDAAVTGILLNDLQVGRTGEGTVITDGKAY